MPTMLFTRELDGGVASAVKHERRVLAEELGSVDPLRYLVSGEFRVRVVPTVGGHPLALTESVSKYVRSV